MSPDIQNVRADLEKYGINPRENLGQHFPIDTIVIQSIVTGVRWGANVVEIGAGTGHITRVLAQRVSIVLVFLHDLYL